MRDRGRRALAQPRREKIGAPCKNNRIYNGFTASGLSGCLGTVGARGQLRVVAFELAEALERLQEHFDHPGARPRAVKNKNPARGRAAGKLLKNAHSYTKPVTRSTGQKLYCQKLYFQEPNRLPGSALWAQCQLRV